MRAPQLPRLASEAPDPSEATGPAVPQPTAASLYARLRPRFVSTWLVVLGCLVMVALLMIAGKSLDTLAQLGLYLKPARAHQMSRMSEATTLQAAQIAAIRGVPQPEWAVEYEHGWPSVYLRRVKCYGDGWASMDSWMSEALIVFGKAGWPHGVSWSAIDAWPLSGDRWRFDLTVLFIDALVAIGLVSGVAAAWEWRLRLRGSLWRLSLSDFVAAISAVCLALGWYAWEQREDRLEHAAIMKLMPPHSKGKPTISLYHGPDWLPRILGNVVLCPNIFCRSTHLVFYGDTVQSDDWSMLSDITKLRSITFIGEPPPASLHALRTAHPELQVTVDLDPASDDRKRRIRNGW